MTQPFRSTPETKEAATQGELVIRKSFDYAALDAALVGQVQTAAQRIRLLVQRTLEDIIAVGRELLAVKATLPRGQFHVWLRAEFDWNQRTAERFMAVAQRFGSQIDTVSIMRIDLTAAHLLAAPNVPEQASAAAFRRAQNGERITASVAKEILSSYRSRPERREKTSPAEWPAGKLRGQLLEILESFRQRCNPRQVDLLARPLRDFADSLQDK